MEANSYELESDNRYLIRQREVAVRPLAIRPLRGQCLVEILRENKIKGGLAIPETAKAKDDVGRLPGLTAKVWRLGPWPVKKNGKAVLPEFASGDRVYVNQYAGKKVKYAGGPFRLVSIEDVLAVLP